MYKCLCDDNNIFFFSSRRRHTRLVSDWSSDVCSSDLAVCSTGQCGGVGLQCAGTTGLSGTSLAEFNLNANGKIGRASCRERVWKLVLGVKRKNKNVCDVAASEMIQRIILNNSIMLSLR